MWIDDNRIRYDRGKLHYLSDLFNEEWALVKPKIPRAKRAATRPRAMYTRWLTN
jgi:hypothetical protein